MDSGMKRFTYLALAALVAVAACDEGEELPSGTDETITGTVVATVSAENAGVQGVTVNLVGPTTGSQETNASGQVTFNNVAEGAYAVTISGIPSGYVFSNTSATTNITTQGQTATVAFTGQIVRSASISGQVTAGGEAVEGATIEIDGPEGAEQAQTGAAGTYEFTGLIAGDYTVTLMEADLAGIMCAETTLNRALEPGESEVANFSCAGAQDPASVAIERITTPTGAAVDRTAVQGMIVIQVGVDEGGHDVTQVNVMMNDIQVCSQVLDSNASPEGPMAVEEEFEIDCVVNTAAIRNIMGEAPAQFAEAGDGNPFEPIFVNDDISIMAEAITDDDEDQDPNATETITLANLDRLALDVGAENPDAPNTLIKTTTGLRWLSGSLTFTVYPIIYSAPFDPNDPTIARASFGFDSYVSNEITTHYTNDTDARPNGGAPAIPARWALSSMTPNSDGSFTFNLPDSITGGSFVNGVLNIGNGGGVEDLITGTIGAQNIRIGTITAFGQNGPGVVCVNISTTCVGTGATTSFNPLTVFYQGVLQSGTGAVNNVLRVDNQEPWSSTIALDPHPLTTMFPTPAAGITANGVSALRGGANYNALRDGWVNHDYAFDAGMWANTTATDAPNVYPVYPDTDGDGFADILLPTGIIGNTTALSGIGLASSPLSYYAMASDNSDSPSAYTITGIWRGSGSSAYFAAERLRNVTGTMVSVGADLPGETGLGLDALPPPNTNEWNDVSLVAVVIDLFENAGITNILEVGVDGLAPVFMDPTATPNTVPTNPTVDGTLYNTYGAKQASNESNTDDASLTCFGTPPNETCTTDKIPGVFAGTTTDTNQGFSGVAGVDMSDWENGCAAGVNACTGSFRNERTGVTLQAAAGGGATTLLAWEWSYNMSTFLAPTGGTISAWTSTVATPVTNDGYRVQQAGTWDRAANVRMTDPVPEHNNDKTRPFVGNVEMPTVPMFTLGTMYTFRGQDSDIVDLKEADFVFDFNTIRTVQTYADAAVGTPFAPGVDAHGEAYVANSAGSHTMTGNSLQLPMAKIVHTAFGSGATPAGGSILLLDSDLEATVEFLGCVVLFDEGGIPQTGQNRVHIPRGPRWRTWDHAYPYGLLNTQFNTFTPSSVPVGPNPQTCADGSSAADIRNEVFPSANTAGAWDFGIGVQTGGTSLELTTSGPSGTFVPNFDITALDLYYIDAEGRARIMDLSGTNWSGPVVSDTGTGPLGRTYTWTYVGTLATETNVPMDWEHGDPFFFVLRLGDGMAIMWDDASNP
jgi:hypothetical protein